MSGQTRFQRRGIVEGFFGPPWSMAHRAAIFEFGARRGMNTYLYAPKDDPYHRERWKEPYPEREWEELLKLIHAAQKRRIDFVYGFHPGKGLCFSEDEPIRILLAKAQRFYDAGVRTFAVLFDDIPSRLEHKEDQAEFDGSLAKAEAIWLRKILDRQPATWREVEWWICPSYYTEDPLLARMFGAFEPRFLETLSENLPESVACFWTGPKVVPKTITLAHVRKVVKQLKHRLILWDNYPVNDLSMGKELHLSPLAGRDPRLPEAVYGYLNNPLLQENLSFIPLATCFDYAANPARYDSEESWRRVIMEIFGREALNHWRALRRYCERVNRAKDKEKPLPLSAKERPALVAARRYVLEHQRRRWVTEIRPWLELLEKSLTRKTD
ncbi:MAG: beta-N-acetylglucosaminidase domain-containing protein [Deltaproteobacteria bacterium]|nr:beta-N-acetylglucosaminidase domain-containing protein [Deltaproteobacteria bacterium]MBI2538720.1 beta-N-acetylglucosaminidase domain-containing protein [Deltaproteobacteria bacterium]MBI3061618.1 beta-N-acetylglucosaminidase domain-containing protein [Deltaproteobacteria bacterium]